MNVQLEQLLPIAIPLLVIGLILVVFSILDLRKQTATRGPKWMWALIICFGTFWGPITYFVIGRKEE